MFFRITHPENATGFIDNMRLGECVMIIAAKRHNIKLGINNAPYPHFGNLNPTHYDDFLKQITKKCKNLKLTPPKIAVPGIHFDLSWADESPETLRFVKAVFRKPELIISKLQFTTFTEKNIKYTVPTPPALSDFPDVAAFKSCKRQFIKLEGMQSNLELIAANFLSLTLSPDHISRIITLTMKALHLKNDEDPIVRALGISTPMSAVIAWAEKKGISQTEITHLEQTIKFNKRLLSNAIKRYCIDKLRDQTQGTSIDSIEIAKKIRNYYHNSKKTLDGRKLAENKPIKILLKAEVLKKLEKHRISTDISRTEFIENLINKHFDELAIKEAEARATNQRNKNAPSSNSTNPEPRNSFGAGSNNFTNNSATTMNNSHQTLPINNMPNYPPIFPTETNNNKSTDDLSPYIRATKTLRGE